MKKISVYAVVASDFHMGSKDSNAGQAVEVFERFDFENLIIVGDLHETGKEISEDQFELVKYLRSVRGKVVYARGNHDPKEDNLIEGIIGVKVRKDYECQVNGNRFYFNHGDKYDKIGFIFSEPFMDRAFWHLIWALKIINIQGFDAGKWLDWLHRMFSDHITAKVRKDAIRRGCNTVVCGHTHVPLHLVFNGKNGDKIDYYNCGGWVGGLRTYLTIDYSGRTELHSVD